jgi:hypothetical protein
MAVVQANNVLYIRLGRTKTAWLGSQAVFVHVPNVILTTGTHLSPAYKSVNTDSNQQDNTLDHFRHIRPLTQ